MGSQYSKHLSYARHYSWPSLPVSPKSPKGRNYYYHFIDEETEAWREFPAQLQSETVIIVEGAD